MERDFNKAEYDDSVEFTNEMLRLKELTTEFTRIVRSPAFADWMKKTDMHFNTDCMSIHRQMKSEVSHLDSTVDYFLAEIDKADNGDKPPHPDED